MSSCPIRCCSLWSDAEAPIRGPASTRAIDVSSICRRDPLTTVPGCDAALQSCLRAASLQQQACSMSYSLTIYPSRNHREQVMSDTQRICCGSCSHGISVRIMNRIAVNSVRSLAAIRSLFEPGGGSDDISANTLRKSVAPNFVLRYDP